MSAPRRRSSSAATVRWLLGTHLVMVAWSLGILALAVVVAVALIVRFGELELSVVQFGRQAYVWFPFSIAIATSWASVGVLVAAGVTRRTIGWASLLVAATTAAAYTVAMTVAFQVERLVFDAAGWGRRLIDQSTLFDDTSQVGLILVDLAPIFLTAQVSGLLVGIVYYRAGGWWGTLTLPFTVGPLLLVSPLLTTSLLDPLGTLARLPLALLVPVALGAVFLVLLRRVELRPVTT